MPSNRDGGRRSAMLATARRVSSFASFACLFAALALPWATAPAGAADPIKIGFSMALTGGVAPNGKQLLLGARNLARRRQRQGRHHGPPGRARLLRRPEQRQQRAGHLHQAAQRRQSRPAARALCHQYDRAGDAGDHGAEQDDDRHARREHQSAVQLFEILLDDPGRQRGHARLLARLVRGRDGAEPEA